jgi:PTS system glucose-specific IIC component
MLKLTKTQQSFGEVTAVKNKNGKDGHIREFLSKLSRGLMLPVAMMPVAGMLLGIGSAFTSKFAAGNG